MKKTYNMKYVFTLLLAFISLMGFAQSQEKAKAILDQVSAKTKSYPSIVADFSFTLENLQEEISETYDGDIILKGNKYKVNLMDVDSYFDGKVLYTHMLDAYEVNITIPDLDDEETLNPATIFTIYEEGYTYNYVAEGSINGKPCHEIDLYPINRDKPFSRIKLLVLKDNLQIYSIRQVGKDGNNYTVIVKNMQTTKQIDDKTFVFDPSAHPDVDVIDMR
ncbi:outer membrane lipoprotein carrier protein LolA [Carboxylicivirga sp. M1479]|uniref:LolA family protein n=1 Tax=Carboxylicivirga sp. M1479 TaxID=2594476 RepID=UPI0011780418|nr:outer membrane lipoprotein carrier protein LolA [Carboxylicivirga sp. M1479]TRX71305.1 outer membrane lipoprotein carrier protein LolA [Carboxylicivirga sp. M1479]